jgi:glycosyltransferase involved in cell wall biosynthesis
MTPTICLNMIVKNESHVIKDTLMNICQYFNFSYWVICDTGSTDGTKQVIHDFFGEKGINGELLEHEWRDFGYNRSLALASAYNKSDYLLVFDADDRIVGDFKLPSEMKADSYDIRIGRDFTYKRTLIVNNLK